MDADGQGAPAWQRLRVLLPAVAMHHVLAVLGTIFSAALITKNPELLLALSSRNRHLLLSVPNVSAVAYFSIAFVRLVFPAVPYYVLGRRYGATGLAWLEREAGGTPGTVAWIERWFARAAVPVILVMPASNVVQVLAGHRRVAFRSFTALVVGSIGVRLLFFWFLGKALHDPLETLLGWIQRYQWWIVIGFFVISILQSVRQVQRTSAAHAPQETEADEVDALAEGSAGPADAEGRGPAAT